MHLPSSWCPVRWIVPLVRSLYLRKFADNIVYIPLSFNEVQDKFFWSLSSTCEYSTILGYSLISSDHVVRPTYVFWKFLWSLSLPMKDILFVRKIP